MKRGQDELIEARRATEAVNRELETFAYTVSHDLRAPLRAVAGFFRSAAAGPCRRTRRWRSRLSGADGKSIDRMRELIDGLLRLSRVGRADLKLERIDLTQVAQEALADLQWEHPERAWISASRKSCGRGGRAAGPAGGAEPARKRLEIHARRGQCAHRNRASALGTQRAFFVRDNGAGFDMKHAGGLFTRSPDCTARRSFPASGSGWRRPAHRCTPRGTRLGAGCTRPRRHVLVYAAGSSQRARRLTGC